MASSKRTEQNRLFLAGLAVAAALNVLFALVHTLRSASPFAAHAWNVTSFGGFMAIAAVLVGAYFFAAHDKRPVLAVGLVLVALLTQVHIFYTQPVLWGWHGALYYLVDAIAVAVTTHYQLVQRRINKPAAPVVSLDKRQSVASRAA